MRIRRDTLPFTFAPPSRPQRDRWDGLQWIGTTLIWVGAGMLTASLVRAVLHFYGIAS